MSPDAAAGAQRDAEPVSKTILRRQNEEERFTLFCFDLTDLHVGFQFVVLAAGIYVNYCAASYAQEAVYIGDFKFTLFLTTVTTVLSLFMGTLAGGARTRVGSWRSYAILGLLAMGTMFFSNASLMYLSYPVQAVFKTSKIIPVMIVGVLLYRKTFTCLHYLSAVLLVVGLTLFTLAGASVSPQFDFRGVVLICCALFADAFIGNYQESMFHNQRPTETEVIVYTNVIASTISLLACVYQQELLAGLYFVQQNPATMLYASIYAAANFFGQFFVLAMIKHFGPVLTVFTTATRKALTVVLSFILFPKPFTLQYLVGGLFVFTGIFMEIRLAQKKATNTARPAKPAPADPEAALETVVVETIDTTQDQKT